MEKTLRSPMKKGLLTVEDSDVLGYDPWVLYGHHKEYAVAYDTRNLQMTMCTVELMMGTV
jgi:hypothetical protein